MSESKIENNFKCENLSVHQDDSLMKTFIGMFWMLWGNIFLVSMAIKISQKQTFYSLYDIFYWVIVVLLAIARYCDVRFCKGVTVKSTPATMEHWRKYIKYLLLISVGLWILATGLSLFKR